MATFRLRGKRWRAETWNSGSRSSASFDSREEAEAWARDQEVLCAKFPHPGDLAKMAAPKRVAAVYFLFDGDGGLLYVGQTGDLHKRLIRHRENKEIAFSSFAFIERGDRSAREEIEALYIKTYRPPCNKAGIDRCAIAVPRQSPKLPAAPL